MTFPFPMFVPMAGTPAIITSLGSNTGSPPGAWLDGVNTGSTVGAFGAGGGVNNYGKDFGSAKTVTQFKVYGSTSRGTNTNGGSGTAYLEYSDNNSSWTAYANSGAVASIDSAGWVATITPGSPSSHRYWRWYVTNTAGDSNMYLAETEWTGY